MTQRSTLREPSARTLHRGSRRHLAWLLLLGATATLIAGQVRAEDSLVAMEHKAVTGQLADIGSTGMGLVLGAAEANPLGLVSLGVKAIAYQQIKEAPATEQPRLWSAYGAFGWGATANNVCVIASIATGGAAAALCPLVGLMAGMSVYSGDEDKRDRETFAAICEQQRRSKPDLVCEFKTASAGR